jgi:hypothetical protein
MLAAKKWKSDILLSRYFSVATPLNQARRAAVGLGEDVHVAVERADGHAQQFDEMFAIGNAAVEQRFELDAARETMISAVVFVVHQFLPLGWFGRRFPLAAFLKKRSKAG